MTHLITPRLNINGTSAVDLIDPRRKAIDLIGELVETLKQVTPNGRDYPAEHATRLSGDRATHFDRLSALRDLQAALLQEAVQIMQQEEA